MALTKTPADQQFDPNAPHEPTPYPGEAPATGEYAPPYIAPNIPDPEADPDKHWQNYGVQAINQLYPWARNGVDFAWGRPPEGGDATLLEWSENLAPADEGAIEEAARKLAEADPYGPNYTPRPSLAPGVIRNDPGEVQRPRNY